MQKLCNNITLPNICKNNANNNRYATYAKHIGKSYFSNSSSNLIDLSITPNRPDCLGVRGIARDLSAAGFGNLKPEKDKKIKSNKKQTLKVPAPKE